MENQRALCEKRQLQFPPRYESACKIDTPESFSDFFHAAECEMPREPEVPEARVPVVECLDGLARMTTKEFSTNSFCEKWHPPECV